MEENVKTIEEIVAENEDLKVKLEAEHNNYLRALADSENIRKNFAKKQADLYQYKHEDIMKEMLDILDDVDRGISHNELSEGGKLIFNKLNNKLNKFGLTKINIEKGTEFNADTMEAISVLQFGEEMKNKVIDCTTVGYSYNGKIIRYPKVVVGV